MNDLDRRILRQILSNQFTLLKLALSKMDDSEKPTTADHLRRRLSCTDQLLKYAFNPVDKEFSRD